MALTTFGAIIGFATEMVGKALAIHQDAVEKAEDPALRESLQALLQEEKKNYSLMEQTRREKITEMILEPITGFQQEDYEVDLKPSDRADDVDLLKMALILEEKGKKFFLDASDKVSLPEVARIFRKIAERKEKNLTKLNSLDLTLACSTGSVSQVGLGITKLSDFRSEDCKK